MQFVVAILLALGLIAGQVAHGAALAPFLAIPAFALVALAAVLSVPAALAGIRGPATYTVVPVLALFGYLAWRCLVEPPDPELAALDLTLVLACVCAWAAVVAGLRGNGGRLTWMWIFMAGGLVQVAVAVWQMTHSEFGLPWWGSEMLRSLYESRYATRARGSFLNPNQFAWMMNAAALVALSLGTWGRMRITLRLVILYLALLFIVMSMLSASRGGALSLAGGLAVFAIASLAAIFFVLRRGRGLMLLGAVLSLALCLGAGYLAFSLNWVTQGRFGAFALPDVRVFFSEHAFRLFQQAPVFGTGPETFRYAARLFRNTNQPGDALFAHDDWLQCLSEYGIVGFGLALLVLVCGVSGGIGGFFAHIRAGEQAGGLTSTRGAFALGGACVVVAFGIHSLTDFNLHVPANSLLGAMMLGFATMPRGETLQRGVSRHVFPGLLTAGALTTVAVGLVIVCTREARPQWETLRGQDALYRGDTDSALGHFRKALKWTPNSPQVLSLEGQALYEYESWLEARRAETEENPDEASQAEENTAADSETDDEELPDFAPILSDEQRTELFRTAANSYAKAAQLQPLERVHRVGLARALVEIDKKPEAIREFIRAIKLDPADGYPWGSYGDYLLEMDEIDRALKIFSVGIWLADSDHSRDQYDSLLEDLNTPEDEK